MSKPRSIYMWDNVDKTIKIIESRTDLIYKTTDLYDPQYFSKDNEDCSLKSSHIIGEFLPMKNQMILCVGLNPNVHPLMNDSLRWEVVLIQHERISCRHFQQLTMNSYLYQKISP